MKRWPKFKCRCTACDDLCIVKPLYPTTKAERVEMARTYVCADCVDRRMRLPAALK